MADETLRIELENIGGIDHLELSVTEGVTFVQGPNATNKTSLLRGVLFALGSETVPIRSSADEARAVVSTADRRVERVARRTDGGIETDGEAWVDGDDALLLERFAALVETNALRSAVARDESIEPLLKEPMDIDSLEAERAAKIQRKRRLAQKFESTDDVPDRLAERERELAEKRDRIESLEADLEEFVAARETDAADDELEELRERRAELRSDESEYVDRVAGIESAIERLEDRLAATESDLAAARDRTEDADLEAERDERREELADVTGRLEVLQSVLTANREMLESDATGALGYESTLLGDEVTCWTCGGTTTLEDVEDAIDDLTELVEADKRRKRDREPEIEELTERIEGIREAKAEIRELEAETRELEEKLENRRESLTETRTRLSAVRDDLEAVDEAIASREADRDASSDRAAAIEETRVELRTLRREADRLEETCESLRETRNERRRTREAIEGLDAEITALTDRIENLEGELREVFNTAMDELLSALEFERIDRVWLDGAFEIVIAREIDDRTRTETLEHLAESEREMIGLVLALAGFVTYDVAEVAPVLALDSLGAFDAARTHRLVEYFADETDFLLATAHPETDLGPSFETVTFERTAAN